MRRPISITSTGKYLPLQILTNDQLPKELETSDQWIQTKVGVRERHIASPNESTSDLAVSAALIALDKAKVSPLDIDLIIVATSTPDMIQPPTASIVQGKLGAYRAAAFDVGAVCAGSVFALDTGVGLMQSHPEYKRVLVIGAETYSRILDWTDRTTCVFFGDGAGAALLTDVEPGKGILHSLLGTDGRKWDVITFLGGGSRYPANHESIRNGLHKFRMRGKDVWEFATTVVPDAVETAVKQISLKPEDIDFIIFHQANINIIETNMKKLGLPMSKTYTCLDRYANTSGASVLIALDEAIERGMIKIGDIVALVGFGGGLSWGVSLWRWA